ncbi:rRNA adenine N(6)-methyltransferase family protein [Phytoactinopolyspora mesophila]|uniref:Methyltransferase domain-containing protein n=1 Tax=Phytoactinopolyspora mesophila TaxID=2650750 RepID=A0A7K3M0P2_9ACTN|nr:rRNA adenine N(6)-methyltransferase family protein [Phytoactinopolyspora mesophila]NDL56018.1 methyltransferase domain-containing protein [Phytoactinopolyspora mesophila]
MPSRRTSARTFPDNPSGIHLLKDPAVVRRMIRSAQLDPQDLVVEFGAGTGKLTSQLSGTGARIIAVERHPDLVARLERRFSEAENVRIVAGDARSVPLPRRPYAVVANIPYSISTSLFRRILTPDQTALQEADILVEWGFAKRVTAEQPRNFEIAWWQLRFELSIVGRVRPHSFAPPPSVDTAHLRIRRRSGVSAGLLQQQERRLRQLYRPSRRLRRR